MNVLTFSEIDTNIEPNEISEIQNNRICMIFFMNYLFSSITGLFKLIAKFIKIVNLIFF